MNFSSSVIECYEVPVPVSPLFYPDVAMPCLPDEVMAQASSRADEEAAGSIGISTGEVEQLLTAARAEASAERDRCLRAEFDAKLSVQAQQIREAVDEFATQRRLYFSRVEAEVIRLALAIAAKILHRESQADPMLIAAMVRIALDKLQEGSSVSLRVPPSETERWEEYMAAPPHGIAVEVGGDPQLAAQCCILRAELGSVDFSIDAQLKEVEQGFFDLLAHRPVLQ